MPTQINLDTVSESVSLQNSKGSFPALIICEHASNHIPQKFNNLGLSTSELKSHIAWDPGAAKVAENLSKLLDAPFVKGEVSRLVYDCNRPPKAPDAMPERSERFEIPGNQNLSENQRNERVQEVYMPFKNCIEQSIATSKIKPALITIHSFTSIYHGQQRDVEFGILHDSDSRLADAILSLAPKHTILKTLRNEPYGPQDGVTHTLHKHGVTNGLLNVMIEIRNDLIATSQQCEAVADMLFDLVSDALGQFEELYNRQEQA